MVIDGHIGNLSSSLLVAPARPPGDSLADPFDPAEFLRVQVEEIAKPSMYIPR